MTGALVLGPRGVHHLADGRVVGEDPLAPFGQNAARHLARTDGFPHVADLMVGSFYDPALDEGCAFEELISFHGGLGGPQTRPFILSPVRLPLPDEPIVGAESTHRVLLGWRRLLQGGGAEPAQPDDAGADQHRRAGFSSVVSRNVPARATSHWRSRGSAPYLRAS